MKNDAIFCLNIYLETLSVPRLCYLSPTLPFLTGSTLELVVSYSFNISQCSSVDLLRLYICGILPNKFSDYVISGKTIILFFPNLLMFVSLLLVAMKMKE